MAKSRKKKDRFSAELMARLAKRFGGESGSVCSVCGGKELNLRHGFVSLPLHSPDDESGPTGSITCVVIMCTRCHLVNLHAVNLKEFPEARGLRKRSGKKTASAAPSARASQRDQ